jgi:hypothetical protein
MSLRGHKHPWRIKQLFVDVDESELQAEEIGNKTGNDGLGNSPKCHEKIM